MLNVVTLQTIGLLFVPNIFMRLAGHGDLKSLNNKPWWIAAFINWRIALVKHLFQVPANRIDYTQLKILQKVITLIVFFLFATLYIICPPFKLNYVWAALCLVGAVYFVFHA